MNTLEVDMAEEDNSDSLNFYLQCANFLLNLSDLTEINDGSAKKSNYLPVDLTLEEDNNGSAKLYTQRARFITSPSDLTDWNDNLTDPVKNNYEHSSTAAKQVNSSKEVDSLNVLADKNNDTESDGNNQWSLGQVKDQCDIHTFHDEIFNQRRHYINISQEQEYDSLKQNVFLPPNITDSSAGQTVTPNSSRVCDNSTIDVDNSCDMTPFLSQTSGQNNDEILTEFTNNLFHYKSSNDLSGNVIDDSNSSTSLSEDLCLVEHDGQERSPVCPRAFDSNPSTCLDRNIAKTTMASSGLKKKRGRPPKRHGKDLTRDPSSKTSSGKVTDKFGDLSKTSDVCKSLNVTKPSSYIRGRALKDLTLNNRTQLASEDNHGSSLLPPKRLRSSNANNNAFNVVIDIRRTELSSIELQIKQAKDNVELLSLKKIRFMLKKYMICL